MPATIGIRREDKNEWERRVPFVPGDLAEMQAKYGHRFLVQPSAIRIYRDEDFLAAGINVSDDLAPASLILAIREVPPALLLPGRTYALFAHVVKGQPHNMPMLRRLLELGCSLVDYEKITDEHNRRLIFFGRHAGYAGMVETLRCLGQRLAAEGMQTPLAQVRHAYAYQDLESAKSHLTRIGKQIMRVGLPRGVCPLVVGFSGHGNVSRGAQEVFDCLRVREIAPADLQHESHTRHEWGEIIKSVFREQDMVEPVDASAPFDLQEYHVHPERYRSRFERYLPCLDVLVNGIYWEERYPRLVTLEWARRNCASDAHPRLKVIGDISCDIGGSIEITRKATKPDSPCFVYDPATDTVCDGVSGPGPAIMAIDNLPCEFPLESSQYLSVALRDIVRDLAAADWQAEFERLNLPAHLKKAVIVYKGELTPAYRYLQHHLDSGTHPDGAA